VTVVTPPALADDSAVQQVSDLWKSAGSSVTVMDAASHDRILAATSHLPHVVAAALALSAGDNGLFCGSGFRDTTRIADGSPQVWSDIVRTNAPALKASLEIFCQNISALKALVDEGDGEKLANWFAAARDKRKELLG
jgi:cyclohexadieny/prephenate dehydrogenase